MKARNAASAAKINRSEEEVVFMGDIEFSVFGQKEAAELREKRPDGRIK